MRFSFNGIYWKYKLHKNPILFESSLQNNIKYQKLANFFANRRQFESIQPTILPSCNHPNQLIKLPAATPMDDGDFLLNFAHRVLKRVLCRYRTITRGFCWLFFLGGYGLIFYSGRGGWGERELNQSHSNQCEVMEERVGEGAICGWKCDLYFKYWDSILSF